MDLKIRIMTNTLEMKMNMNMLPGDIEDDYDDYDNDQHHNVDHSDVVDPSTKGPGRGWGAMRSDGGRRYTKSTKIKHQESPKRPKLKRKEHVRDKTNEIEEYQEDVEDIFFDYELCDSYSYSYNDDYGRWDREHNPMPPCTTPAEAWALMSTSSTTFEKIYSAHFGGFITLGYRETYNVVSNVVMQWIEKNPVILAKQFIAELFGPEYQMQRTPWIFTKTAREHADKLFGISTFHHKLKDARSFICVNRVKESCSQTGGYAIPFKPWRELLNRVNKPGELLKRTIESKINKVLDDKYLIWLQQKLLVNAGGYTKY